jgi:aminomethyltransferase
MPCPPEASLNASKGSLRRTPLYETHREAGGRMVEFAGWEMPVQYDGVVEEHRAVRTRAGIFDVSHMGEVELSGPGALETLQRLTCNDVSRLVPGRAHYSALTNEKGAFVDDVVIYRREEERFLICVNASNEEKDFAWMRDHRSPGAEAVNRSADFAQIALQGPDALGILMGLTDADLQALGSFSFVEAAVIGHPCIVSRTGYTGEDGFEIYCPPGAAAEIWHSLTAAGAPFGLVPCGLAARDTLRLEACLMLYGNDIDDTTTVLEAGLSFIVKLGKGEFMGSDVLRRQKETGVARRLSAFEMIDRGIARHGYEVQIGGVRVGDVTSGTHGPFVGKSIGLTYLPADAAREGSEIEVIIRGKGARARVVRSPFYRRQAEGR